MMSRFFHNQRNNLASLCLQFVHLSFSEDLMKAVVENADPALMVAGMLQGVFELTTGKGSTYDYTRSDDGTLTVTVKVMEAEDVELQKQEGQ